MTKSSILRIAPGAEGVSIWSSEIFGNGDSARVREFLTRAFAVSEVERVELRRSDSFGRIQYGAGAQPAKIWKKLSQVFKASNDDGAEPISTVMSKLTEPIDVGPLYLDVPRTQTVRVSRIGGALSTWLVRHQSADKLQLSHPFLRHRRDVVFRLEEELAGMFGVESFSTSALTASVSIHFDARSLTAERVARQLEQAWPRLLQETDGLAAPPSRKRFVAAGGLLGLAFTGQYLVPGLRPAAVVGMALYGLPNVINGSKELRRGQVGLSALYATGLGFMLISGMPFASALFSVLTQYWPHAARQKLVRSQRRLFAGQRRRPVWARLSRAEGHHIEVSVEALRPGDRVVVHAGEVIPVDGVVAEGAAVITGAAPFSPDRLQDVAQGDAVSGGALVQVGSLKIRVERVGRGTVASYVDSLLPHAPLTGLPSSLEAEAIANRNAKPALVLSLANLLLTRTLRPSQAVIRPDYATGPRLSAQLSTVQGIAQGLQLGVLFRKPAALDRIARAAVIVFDDTAGLDRQQVRVVNVQAADGTAAELVAGYAFAALGHAYDDERRRALAVFLRKHNARTPRTKALQRGAGVTRYLDRRGRAIELVTAQYLAAAKIDVPTLLRLEPAKAAKSANGRGLVKTNNAATVSDSVALRPLWVLRDGKVIGAIAFQRSGALVGRPLLAALRLQNPHARFVYTSDRPQVEVQALASKLGIEIAYGELNAAAKADVIRGLGRKTVWVGDGSDAAAGASIAASTVSVSVAPLSPLSPVSDPARDVADVLLPHDGVLGLLDVIDLGLAHRARLAKDYRTVYTTNLLGVLGAFLARFGSLQSGLLSHAGSGVIYVRHARALDRLASVIERKRARVQRSSLG